MAGGAPPRQRGGLLVLVPADCVVRNTPTSAGSAGPSRTACRRRAEYPQRGRGGPGDLVARLGRPRSTPASAGRTRAAPPRCYGSADHPRVGGEDGVPRKIGKMANGTPSRRRGGRRQSLQDRPRHRSTPASAGRTRTGTALVTTSSEHPRVGGEDGSWEYSTRSGAGTPPRRRGGLHGPGQPPHTAPEHPRVGGEDKVYEVDAPKVSGTSRVGRGRLLRGEPGAREGRNTPASAGRTGRRALSPSSSAEHPRVGGEDYKDNSGNGSRDGAPPRRWGEPAPGRAAPHDLRDTPASAGRTPAPAPSGPPSPEHPRVGGEDASTTFVVPHVRGTPPRRRGGRPVCARERKCRRNTPASAGKTPAPACTRPPSSEHPRVGGEDSARQCSTLPKSGTPPRRRGGPDPQPHRPHHHRNTPASAGRARWT